MKAQDKQMIRDLATLIGEQIIDTAEKAEAVVKAKEKADRKERKAAAKRRAKKAAKKRHPSTRTPEVPYDEYWDSKMENPNDVFIARLKAGEVQSNGVPVKKRPASHSSMMGDLS